MKTLQHVGTEMALHVLAYNMKRVMRILGVGGLIEAIRNRLCRSCPALPTKTAFLHSLDPQRTLGLATFRLVAIKASIVPTAPHRKVRKPSNPKSAEANRLASWSGSVFQSRDARRGRYLPEHACRSLVMANQMILVSALRWTENVGRAKSTHLVGGPRAISGRSSIRSVKRSDWRRSSSATIGV